MTRARHEFDRFLRAAHRRWVVWRVVERAGVAALWASALALPLIAVLWSRGEPAPNAVALVLGAGALLGAAWGALRRPTLLDTAMEADRQFDLHDLLGTAMTLSSCAYSDDTTRAAITATADARCRRIAASRMVLNKLGARAWAGIGLANALVVTLSLMTSAPTPTVAQTGVEPTRTTRSDSGSGPRPSVAANRTSQASPTRDAQISSRDGARTNEGNATREDGSRSPVLQSSDVTSPGDGTGAATQTDQPAPHEQHPDATGREATEGTTTAGGAGTPAVPKDDGTDRAAGGFTRAARSPAPPWRATTWDADRARALRDVERGAVPDRYRDLVRAYFDPDDAREHR